MASTHAGFSGSVWVTNGGTVWVTNGGTVGGTIGGAAGGDFAPPPADMDEWLAPNVALLFDLEP